MKMFRKKKYGVGFTPNSILGWLVTALFVILMSLGTYIFRIYQNDVSIGLSYFTVYTIVITVLFIYIGIINS